MGHGRKIVMAQIQGLTVYCFQDKDFGCVIGRGRPQFFKASAAIRPIPSLLPSQNHYLKGCRLLKNIESLCPII
jgi:hypothetical protein